MTTKPDSPDSRQPRGSGLKMVRPPRSTETINAQRKINGVREKLGSPSLPPENWDDEPTGAGFPPREQTTGTNTSPNLLIGVVGEHARSFKNEYLRLIFLGLVLALLTYLLASGIVRIELGQ